MPSSEIREYVVTQINYSGWSSDEDALQPGWTAPEPVGAFDPAAALTWPGREEVCRQIAGPGGTLLVSWVEDLYRTADGVWVLSKSSSTPLWGGHQRVWFQCDATAARKWLRRNGFMEAAGRDFRRPAATKCGLSAQDLELLAYDLGELFDRGEYGLDLSGAEIRPLLPGLVDQLREHAARRGAAT